ncbi:MAG: ribosome maturation factor RimP [Alphaproteobacteria bacterium]|nr:ribosome maturation factor RimP [Alphaproteobacteria bacterium]
MTLNDTLTELIVPVCEDMGYDLVRLQLQGGNSRKVLQIMAERKDRRAMTVDDCADLSRAISPVLDEHDPIEDNYTLEVSSPGIDRPLVKLDDFDRFKGFEAKIECQILINGRKRFSGRLQGIDGSDVVITFDGADVRIPFDQIAKAKLILTDELLAAFASQSDEE